MVQQRSSRSTMIGFLEKRLTKRRGTLAVNERSRNIHRNREAAETMHLVTKKATAFLCANCTGRQCSLLIDRWISVSCCQPSYQNCPSNSRNAPWQFRNSFLYDASNEN